MVTYEWINVKTGKIVEHDSPIHPPSKRGQWKRLFSFGVGRVEGGASPSRTSIKS